MYELECAHEGCRLPWARLVNGTLVVESRHGGSRHENVISFHVLIRLLEVSKQGENCWNLLPPVDYVVSTIRPASITLEAVNMVVNGFEIGCVKCERPWAYVAKGTLFVASFHDGRHHENRIELDVLKAVFGAKYLVESR